jgi:Arc/MetJ family transcription regulator
MATAETAMRTTLNIDDELISEAQRITGMNERTALIHEGLKALIERESARRLARLGGTEPQLKSISRRRSGRF